MLLRKREGFLIAVCAKFDGDPVLIDLYVHPQCGKMQQFASEKTMSPVDAMILLRCRKVPQVLLDFGRGVVRVTVSRGAKNSSSILLEI